jgi:hypothetical protein
MERADHLYGGLTEVACRRCGACVRVRKHSAEHTNIQWNAASVQKCLEFKGKQSAFVPTCSSLHASIDEAVLRGRVSVPSPVPPTIPPSRGSDG